MTDLRAIPGGRGRPADMEQITCTVCERTTGVATSAFLPALLAPRASGGVRDPSTGTEALICAHCLAHGRITRIKT